MPLPPPAAVITASTSPESTISERTATTRIVKADRRATKITLTAAGRRALYDAEHAMHARLHDVLAYADDPDAVDRALNDLADAITRARNERLGATP